MQNADNAVRIRACIIVNLNCRRPNRILLAKYHQSFFDFKFTAGENFRQGNPLFAQGNSPCAKGISDLCLFFTPSEEASAAEAQKLRINPGEHLVAMNVAPRAADCPTAMASNHDVIASIARPIAQSAPIGAASRTPPSSAAASVSVTTLARCTCGAPSAFQRTATATNIADVAAILLLHHGHNRGSQRAEISIVNGIFTGIRSICSSSRPAAGQQQQQIGHDKPRFATFI